MLYFFDKNTNLLPVHSLKKLRKKGYMKKQLMETKILLWSSLNFNSTLTLLGMVIIL